ncbi:MAG: CPBP family intramembrane metalloprotease [Lachnospiraceae bacterium]|nr:CPBP family intramembrane metalloprotease [Lachnospiraceae bacterium]
MTDAWGYSDLFDFSNGKYIYGYISRLIWVIPAFMLIVKYSNSLYMSRKQLFSAPRFNKLFIITILVSIVLVFFEMLIYHRGLWFNKEVNLSLEIIKLIVVGFVEETVFRGWGYNALAQIVSDRQAIIISTILFVLLHWPAYFIKFYRFGTFDFMGIALQSVSVLVWGVVFCMLLKKGKSLWNPIIVHAFYDIMVVLFT